DFIYLGPLDIEAPQGWAPLEWQLLNDSAEIMVSDSFGNEFAIDIGDSGNGRQFATVKLLKSGRYNLFVEVQDAQGELIAIQPLWVNVAALTDASVCPVSVVVCAPNTPVTIGEP